MITYVLGQSCIDNIKTDRDVLTLLMKHSFESFVFSVRTAEFNYAIARELGFNLLQADKYFMSGLYHDVGKIGMPRFLIDYPGRYTDEMREEMKKHTEGGGRLLENANADEHLIETAKFHHCNFDGTGYLYGYKGEEIPFHARLTRVSDSADAYLSTRSYKAGYKVSELFNDLEQHSRTWYDPQIIAALKRVHERIISTSQTSVEEISQDEYMYFLKKIYGVDAPAENHLFEVIRNA